MSTTSSDISFSTNMCAVTHTWATDTDQSLLVLAIIKKDQSQSASTWILTNRITDFGHVIKTKLDSM